MIGWKGTAEVILLSRHGLTVVRRVVGRGRSSEGVSSVGVSTFRSDLKSGRRN